MKHKLWVFGDSLSVGYNPFNTNGYLYPKPNWWSNILADKLNMESENPSGVGNSNYQIRHKLYESFGDIKENDIIIFQFTFHNRINLEPGNIQIENVSNLNVDDILQNEWNYKWNTFYPKIINWCRERNIKCLFWSSENDIPNHIIDKHWITSPNGGYGVWENWLNIDKHFNITAHNQFAEHIFKKINKDYTL